MSLHSTPPSRLRSRLGFIQSLLLGTLLLAFNNGLAEVQGKKQGKAPLLNFHSKTRKEHKATMCRAHSHNDYHQQDPLSSALEHGLKSVEVDVFPRREGLWVAHTVFDLTPHRTIDNLYIQPLLRILKQRRDPEAEVAVIMPVPTTKSLPAFPNKRFPTRSRAYINYPSRGGDATTSQVALTKAKTKKRVPSSTIDRLNLLVDFKGDADKSAVLLQSALKPLKPFLSKVDKNGVFRPGRLTVLISGNRPSEASLYAANGERWLFLDGRIKDIRANAKTDLVPLVSVPWRHVRLARSVGCGERYMKFLSQQAHEQGKLVRIWGAPNKEAAWGIMLRGNVDLLSIDNHSRFAQFVADNNNNNNKASL